MSRGHRRSGRSGISLSMTYVVLGLILLTTAFFVISAVRGGIDMLGGITESQISESQKDLIRSQCLAEKPDACSKSGVSGKQWADEVMYDGRSCRKWHQQHGIFGGDDGIPEC